MLGIIKKFCDRAEVQGVGEKRKAADVSNDSQGGSAAGDGASAPAGKEALPSVGIAKEWSITEILQVVAYLVRLVREVLGITTARDLHEEMMELCGSGERQWRERCHFRRLLERLFDVPGAAALVLKYLGEFLTPTGLGEGGGAMSMSTTFGFANVIAVLLSIRFDEEGFECSASQVHDAAARGNPDLIDVLLDAGADINKPDRLSGRSLLHVASANGLASTVAKLLNLGAHQLRKD
jgi:hypothetical protein